MNPNLISTIVLAAHWLIICGLTLRIILQRPPVGVSLAWLAVVFSVPFVGAGVYLLFGEKRLGWSRRAATAACLPALGQWQQELRDTCGVNTAQLDAQAAALARHADKSPGFPLLPGNVLQLLTSTDAFFDRLVADIDSAVASVHIGFYLYQDGGRVDAVLDALVAASARGVSCRVLADALGSKRFLLGSWAHRLRQAGVALVTALPTGALRTLVARADLRNHRKIAVIDGCVAYSGSHNLVDPHRFKVNAGVGEWVDAMVRITGPAAATLDSVFQLDWAIESGTPFAVTMPAAGANPESSVDMALVQIVPSGPDLQPEAIHRLLLSAIYSAQRELVLTTPYFVPDDAIVTALITAALRGVQVTLIVPTRNDSRLVRYASAAHYDELLAAGVSIARFNGGLLHTKSLTIDGAISMFGSVNLDMRSLWLNFEISLLIYDAAFTRNLRELQNSYLRDASLMTLAQWRQRAGWRRVVENTCRLVGPLL